MILHIAISSTLKTLDNPLKLCLYQIPQRNLCYQKRDDDHRFCRKTHQKRDDTGNAIPNIVLKWINFSYNSVMPPGLVITGLSLVTPQKLRLTLVPKKHCAKCTACKKTTSFIFQLGSLEEQFRMNNFSMIEVMIWFLFLMSKV